MTTRRRLGWMELIEGILLIALGIVTLVRPRGALTTLVAAYGVIALLTGLVDIAFYIVMEKHTGFGPTISLVTGILSVLAGCALIAHPEIGLNLLLIIFPVWFLTHCISRLTHLDIVRLVAGKCSFYLTLAANIVGIVLSVMMLFDPMISIVSMSVLIGADLILLGLESVVFAVGNYRYRHM